MNPITSDRLVVPAKLFAEDQSEMGGVQIDSEEEDCKEEEVIVSKIIREAPLEISDMNNQGKKYTLCSKRFIFTS